MPCMGDPDDLDVIDDIKMKIPQRRRDRVVVGVAKFIGWILVAVAFLILVTLGIARELQIWGK